MSAGHPIIGFFRGGVPLPAEDTMRLVDRVAPSLAPWAAATDWFVDAVHGVGICRPNGVIDAEPRAALAVRGAVTTPGRDAAPGGWNGLPPPEGLARLFYDLLDRGLGATAAMRGQFALALWDGRLRRLMLVRDQIGQRSLFTRHVDGWVFFSSEIDVLFRIPGVVTRLGEEGALWYLAFGMPPPGGTLVPDIRRLPAGNALVLEPGSAPMVQRYWTPLRADAPREASPEVLEAIAGRIKASLARHLAGAHTPGLLLSGGVDSTYLASIAGEMGVAPRAYTVEFEAELGMNETEYADAVARWLGLAHQVVRVAAPAGLRTLEETVLHAAEPCAAWAAISHSSVLEAAHDDGTDRIISGLGADEIFGGYDHFRGAYCRYLRWVARTSPGDDPFGSLLLVERPDAWRVLYAGVARLFDDLSLRRGLAARHRGWHYAPRLKEFYRSCRELKPDAAPMELMVAHECQHRIPDLLLANFEPLGRKTGIEMCYPFLDVDVIGLVAGLAVEERYRTPKGRFSLRLRDLDPRFKYAMMRLAEARVPEEIRSRPRKSLTAPFGGWFFIQPFRDAILARVRASGFWELGIVRREWLDTIIEHCVPGPNKWVFQLWGLVTLTGWFDRWVDGRPSSG